MGEMGGEDFSVSVSVHSMSICSESKTGIGQVKWHALKCDFTFDKAKYNTLI